MKKFLLIIVFSSATLFAQYTTPGTGVNWTPDSLKIYAASTITGTYPNYIVNGLITVSANDIVRVLPGTTISFTSTTSGFTVNGAFQAIGTAASKITFTSPTPDSLGAYNGLTFNDISIDSLCIVRYANIEYAYYGCRTIGASPTYEYNYLFKNRRGFNLSSSDAIIRFNTILRSYENGITMTLGCNPIIENNTIGLNNTQNTSAKNQISIGLQGNNSPIIRNNIIYGGESIRTGGISLWVSGSSAFSNSIIENNTIYNNAFGITLYSTSGGTINAVVRGNTIYNNNLGPDPQTSGSGINVNGITTNTPIISHNRIFGNWWGITIQNGTTVQAGPEPKLGNLSNSDTTDDGYNKIYNNTQSGGVFDLYNNCTNNIYAQNNDWGVYDSALIEANIFHRVDNPLHGFVSFTPFFDTSTIPVELSSFNAVQSGDAILIIWKTATETNNKGFYLERRKNTESWKNISFVKGMGTSVNVNEYSVSDIIKSNGKYCYRLRQIDYDGTERIVAETEVDFSIIPKAHSLSQNFPNPFNPVTKIKYVVGGDNETTVRLKIFNLLGKDLAVLVNEKQAPGNYEVELNLNRYGLSSLASGVYFYQLSVNNVLQTKKFILNK